MMVYWWGGGKNCEYRILLVSDVQALFTLCASDKNIIYKIIDFLTFNVFNLLIPAGQAAKLNYDM